MVLRYMRYRMRAGTAYDVHSPHVYTFIHDILEDSRHFYAFDEIEQLRHALLADKRTVHVTDFGAGSRVLHADTRSIRSIARNTLITPKFGRLLFYLVDQMQPARILEMGTSLGISTLYLAKAAEHAHVITLEGSTAIAQVAEQNFERSGVSNIRCITGEFLETLPVALQQLGTVDLAFIDGNHRKEPTLSYFEAILPYTHEQTLFVFDDIHWSKDMEGAWNTICAHPKTTCTLDLFFKGIVYVDHSFREKQHFTLSY
ncbi:MAG: class I SAM-dependent methyltransferase [Chitinophagales bacterium]